MPDNMNDMEMRGKGSMVSSNTPTSLLLNSGLVNSSLSSIMNRNPPLMSQPIQPGQQQSLPSHQTHDHIGQNIQQQSASQQLQQSMQQQHDQSQIHQLNQAPLPQSHSQALPSVSILFDSKGGFLLMCLSHDCCPS